MSCLIMTPQIREIAKSLNMHPEHVKDWIGYWQEQTESNLEAYPTAKQLKTFISDQLKEAEKEVQLEKHDYKQTQQPSSLDDIMPNADELADMLAAQQEAIQQFLQQSVSPFATTPAAQQSAAQKSPFATIPSSQQSTAQTTKAPQTQSQESVIKNTENQKEFESHFTTSKSDKYRNRTIDNVEWSDATVAFALDFNTSGEKLTASVARNKYVAVSLDPFTKGKAAENALAARDAFVQNIKEAIRRGDIKYDEKTGLKLNIAGNGSYTLQDKMPDNRLVRVIKGCLQKLQEEGIKIAEVRSGGQSGADWAGIMAAQELGLPWSVHTTSNYKWREQNGTDVGGKKGFMARFRPETQSAQQTQQKSAQSQTTTNQYEKLVAPEYDRGKFDTRVNPISQITRDKLNEVFKGDSQQKRHMVRVVAGLISNKIDSYMDATTEKYTNAIANTKNPRQKQLLQKQLDRLNRFSIIKQVTPAEIFRDLYYELKTFTEKGDWETDGYCQDYEATRGLVDSGEMTEEQLENRMKMYRLLTQDPDVFRALMEEVCRVLRVTEQIEINTNSIGISEVKQVVEGQYKDDPEELAEIQGDPDNIGEADDQVIKSDWGENIKHISSKDSLSMKVRALLSQIPELDADGNIAYDSMGFTRYLDADVIHTTLNQLFMNMTEPSEMIPILKEYTKNNPWMGSIVMILEMENDEEYGYDTDSLRSQFYTNFRKNFLNYGVQIWRQQKNGSIKVLTKNINLPEGVNHLLNRWKAVFSSGRVLDTTHSVYDTTGKVTSEKSKKNAEIGQKATAALNSRIAQVQQNARDNNEDPITAVQELLEDKDIQRNIITVCRMAGIDTDPEIIIKALSYSETREGTKNDGTKIQVRSELPTWLFFTQLGEIFKRINKGSVQDVKSDDGSLVAGDVVQTLKTYYIQIAKIISKVYNEATVESSTRENGKSYYSHIVPNYLTDLIKQLKNAKGLDRKSYQKWMDEEFGKYPWFKRNGIWLNDWLKQLYDSGGRNTMLDHMEELHFGKVEYSKLSGLQYTVGLLQRFWEDPQGTYAWYHVPIMSNVNSAQFIKFRKIGFDLLARPGERNKGKEKILRNLSNVVIQEYHRINLVAQRNATKGLHEIANFDKRGAEFCFFPALNDKSKFSYKLTSDREMSFYEALDWYIKNDKTKVNDFIYQTLSELMEEEFENAMQEWHKIGLFQMVAPHDATQISAQTTFKYLNGAFAPRQFHMLLMAIRGDENRRGLKNLLQRASDAFADPSNDELIKAQLAKTAGDPESFKEDPYEYMAFLDGSIQDSLTHVEEHEKFFETLLDKPKYYNEGKMISALNDLKVAIESLKEIGYLNSSDAAIYKSYIDNYMNPDRNVLEEYFYNSVYATSQIIQLTTTDLAFYKNIADFQKRYKEVESPAMRLNTQAKFKGQTVGRETERTIYLKDEEIVSTLVDAFKDLLKEKFEKGQISATTYATMMAKYGGSNYDKPTGKYVEQIDPETGQKKSVPQTDKYFKVEWTDKNGKKQEVSVKTSKVNVTDAQAYRSLSSYRAVSAMMGEWTDEKEDAYKAILDGGYSPGTMGTTFHTLKPFVYGQVSQIVGYDENEQPIEQKIPVQHKNSELLILTAYKCLAGELAKSADPNSKVARAVHKLKAINAFMEANQIDVVQFQSAVKVGNQGVIDINKATSEDEIINILTESTKITQGGDPTVIHTIPYANYGIQQTTPDHFLDKQQNVGTQLRRLITSDIASDATFNIGGQTFTKEQWLSLYNKLIAANVSADYDLVAQELSDTKKVADILKRQIQSSQRYSSELLKALKLDEKGQLIVPLYEPTQSRRAQEMLTSIIKNRVTKQKCRGGSLVQASSYGLSTDLQVKFKNDDSAQGIEYIECYMPVQSQAFIEAYGNPDGTVDIDKVPEDLKKVIGYRIPTEDKYSMLPLKIKGYLPQENGGVIILPAEITTIAGSDFDIDKVFFMTKEFSVENVKNEETAKQETHISEISYDQNLSPEENTRQARDNMIFDLMWAQLTHPDTVTKLLNPGGFDEQKTASKLCTLLTSVDSVADLIDLLLQKDPNFAAKGDRRSEQKVIQYLFTLDASTLDNLISSAKKEMNPLSPTTQVSLQQQNMNGTNLIGIYANHNASNAIMQQTDLAVSQNGSFRFNGKTLFSLHNVQDAGGDFISRNTAGYLALAVDDTKERLLAGINQNTFTADVTMLLSRLGYSPTEIGILLNQPIIKEMTVAYQNANGRSKQEIISSVIKKYQQLGGLEAVSVSYKDFKYADFPIENLALAIIQSKIKNKPTNYYQNQMAVGYLFEKMMATADTLSELVRLTKVDNSKGGAGPTIADMEKKISKVRKFNLRIAKAKDYFALTGAGLLKEGLNNIDDVYESPIPAVQAFYTFGIEKPLNNVLNKYFPFATSSFRNACGILSGGVRGGELNSATLNSVYQDFITYILSSNPAFRGKEAFETRQQFVHHFVDYFYGVVNDPRYAKELKTNQFIQNLAPIRAKRGSSLKVLTLQNAGALTRDQSDAYMGDWEALLYSKNAAVQELAVNLARYCFFRSGMSFGNTTFAHVMPVAAREAIPEYLEALRRINAPQENSYDWRNFISQYVRNHLDNNQLVMKVPAGASFQFVQNGNIVDELEIKLGQNSSNADNKIIISAPNEYEPLATVASYISTTVNGQPVYYEIDTSKATAGYKGGDDGSTIVYYKRITPLGKGIFSEYEYGADADTMQSALPLIPVEENDNAETVGDSEVVVEESHDFMVQPEDDRMDIDYGMPNTIQAQDELMQDAFKKMFGQSLDYVEDIPQEVAFSPSDLGMPEYTDAENNPIC